MNHEGETTRIQPREQGRRTRVDGRLYPDLARRPAHPTKRGATAILVSVLLACWLLTGPATAAPAKTPKQRLFATPEAAVQALVEAAKTGDQKEMAAIYGPERDKLLSGDTVLDANSLKRFAEHLGKAAILNRVDDTRYTLLVGEKHWPSPIPIVKEGRKWRFDTAAGLDEILNRKIGQNELSAIMACRAYVLAQWEYYTEARNTSSDGLAVYAQHLISAPGTRDGLYWDVPQDGKPSPLGSLIADAREEGYTLGLAKNTEAPKRSPFHGYFFRILKAQGPHAPGGKFDYVINGNMIAGYALIAYPNRWGSSGVMTFIVNQQGRVYEKDLGSETADLAKAIMEYDPDPSWRLVVEEP